MSVDDIAIIPSSRMILWMGFNRAVVQSHEVRRVRRAHPDKGSDGAVESEEVDTIFLTEALDGGYRLTPHDPDFERQMPLAEEIMRDDREVLRALDK